MDFKKFKAATVQTSPVFLDVEKTIAKAISFVKEAFDISSWDGAKNILTEMEQLVRGVLRDDAPDYDGLLEQAYVLLRLLNQKS